MTDSDRAELERLRHAMTTAHSGLYDLTSRMPDDANRRTLEQVVVQMGVALYPPGDAACLRAPAPIGYRDN